MWDHSPSPLPIFKYMNATQEGLRYIETKTFPYNKDDSNKQTLKNESVIDLHLSNNVNLPDIE